MRRAMIGIVLLSGLGTASAAPPTHFDSAKEDAIRLWWDIGPVSFYCECPYRPATRGEKRIRPGNLWVVGSVCGYEAHDPVYPSGRPNARTMRIEWEHVVPREWIATGFGCQDASVSDCREIDGFEEAESDLFNLVPAIGELNGDRSARPYGVIPGEPREYGSCDFEVTTDGPASVPPHLRGTTEPMPSIRGDIARIWFYIEERYGVVIDSPLRARLEQWASNDPVDERERRRHDRIADKMGWTNPFVAED